MTTFGRKITLYLGAFFCTSFVLLVMSQLPIATLAICGSGFVILLSGVAMLLRSGSDSFHAPLAAIICGLLAFATLSFLANRYAAQQGFVAALKYTLQDGPIWYLVPPAVFAGMCLISLAQIPKQPFGVVSLLPDFGFGIAMMMVFYLGLRSFSGHDPAVSAFFGETIIHYLILSIFFLIASYILRCFLNIWRRGLDVNPGPLLPEERSLRGFIRVLISALPLLGFLGTVLGITQALGGLPDLIGGDGDIGRDISLALGTGLASIAIAFETTMLGLITSLIASLALSYGEKMESDLEADLDPAENHNE